MQESFTSLYHIPPNGLHAVLTNVYLDGTAYQQTLFSLLEKLARLQVLESNTSTSHKRSCFVSAVAFSFFWIKCISLTLFLPSLNLRAVRARRRKDRGSRESRAFVMSSKKRREWSFLREIRAITFIV